ncbi:MAG TPA: M12 family metallopeptidase [Polyangiaceae bacterium]|nr:M12 family metallopeptidase [Polyangiaceae bacterium]
MTIIHKRYVLGHETRLKAERASRACGRVGAWVMLGVLLGACGASVDGKNPGTPREDGPDELVADSTALYMPSGTSNQTNLKLCWDSSAFASGANAKKFADARAAVQDEIRKTWDEKSWVNVSWSDSCSGDMVRIRVADTTAAPAADPHGGTFNFTFKNWGADSACAGDDTQRLSCVRTIAVHEFGHILGFPHEQNRTNGLGIVCLDGNLQPKDEGQFTITEDWDVTGIDTESVMSYCPEGSWSGSLTDKDIEGLRAVYGGEQNPILPNSKAAIRNSDKSFWNGSLGMGPHMAAANIVRRSSGGNGLAYGETISVQIGGAFLCGQKGRAGSQSSVVWNTTFDAASCSWTINRPGAVTGDNELDVNDPFDLALKLSANGSNETPFEKTFSGLRLLRVL